MTDSPAPASEFKNYFGPQSGNYLAFRPRYPPDLLDYLATVSAGRNLVWDCGTGNGQAAVGLAERFDRVVATDPSADMIAHAIPHERVTYTVATYHAGIPDRTADLVTVAQALHWFDLEPFLAEARRVLAPGGVLAMWCYGLCSLNPALTDIVDQYYSSTLGPFWPAERRHVNDGYRSFALPLDEWPAPPFELSEWWTLDDFIHYVRTWSGTNQCIAVMGEAPVLRFVESLATRWGNPEERLRVSWPIHMRLGRFQPSRVVGTHYPSR